MAQLRTLAVPVGVLAAVLLFLLVNPWIVLDGAISQIVTAGFWLSFILLLIILFSLRDDPDAENVEVEGPTFTRFLFNNPRAGLFWLPIRLFVGFQWLEAGWHKVQDPGVGRCRGRDRHPRLLGERGRDPGGGPAVDHLRVVPNDPPVPDRQRDGAVLLVCHRLR